MLLFVKGSTLIQLDTVELLFSERTKDEVCKANPSFMSTVLFNESEQYLPTSAVLLIASSF